MFAMQPTTIRYAPLPLLRAKRPAEVIAVPRTPAPLCTDVSDTANVEPTTSATASEGSNPNLAASSTDLRPTNSESATNSTAKLWPSQIAGRMTTSWLLPAHNDQSSAIAHLLKTEIEAHRISKEMLHATEQRRLEVTYYCQHLEVAKQRLELDARNWAAAYNALAVAFSQCSAEHKRFAGGHAGQGNHVNFHPPSHDASPAQMQECPGDLGNVSQDYTLKANSILD
ncbi:hypothetical protein PMIN06_011966 [Paraphaeosphaeria minitans]